MPITDKEQQWLRDIEQVQSSVNRMYAASDASELARHFHAAMYRLCLLYAERCADIAHHGSSV